MSSVTPFIERAWEYVWSEGRCGPHPDERLLRHLEDHFRYRLMDYHSGRPDVSLVYERDRDSYLRLVVVLSWPRVLLDRWCRVEVCDYRPRDDHYPPRNYRYPRDDRYRNALTELSRMTFQDPIVEVPNSRGVDLLVRICRTIADAVALRMAAALSTHAFYQYPCFGLGRRKRPGICAVHGLVDGSIQDLTQCPTCKKGVENAVNAVDWLMSLMVSCAHWRIQSWRAASESLVTLCLSAGHVLWESLSDWEKRVCMLEREVPVGTGAWLTLPLPPADEAFEDGALRFSLLEFD